MALLVNLDLVANLILVVNLVFVVNFGLSTSVTFNLYSLQLFLYFKQLFERWKVLVPHIDIDILVQWWSAMHNGPQTQGVFYTIL